MLHDKDSLFGKGFEFFKGLKLNNGFNFAKDIKSGKSTKFSRGSKSAKGLKIFIYSFILAISVFSVVMLLLAEIYTGNTIRKGINIEQCDVSWLSAKEAKKLVTDYINENYPEEGLTLRYEEKQWIVPLKDIGFQFLIDDAVKKAYMVGRDGNIFKKVFYAVSLSRRSLNLTMGFKFDSERLRQFIQTAKQECDIVGKNALIHFNNGTITFTEEIVGNELNIDTNVKKVENQLGERNFSTIDLEVKKKKPHITVSDIKNISSVLGSYTTKFSTADKNRTYNINLACSRINGFILMPGEIFSMSKALGLENEDAGYKEAPVIIRNKLTTGSGGGICQVSSTLYNSVLLSGLDVINRTPHSITLTYITPGRDATINGETLDFKFLNNLDYPICINARTVGGTLKINIMGKKYENPDKIKLRTQVIAQYEPQEAEVIIDDTLAYGQSVVEIKEKNGVRVALYRETYRNGVLLFQEKISEDYYKPVRGRIRKSSYNMVLQ